MIRQAGILLVAVSPLMQVVVDTAVTQHAPQLYSVMVMGETGVGKEVLAKVIHQYSTRRGGPFVAFSCAALTDSVVETELFGHERGSFTGATVTRIGLIAAADGGTLFLDEIGDLSLALQKKLLRVLQEREVLKVGATRADPVDFRLICATNRDLAEMVAQGTFREDLYHRIVAAKVIIPPLRERTTDIVPLADEFVRQQAGNLGVAPVPIAGRAAKILERYSWPGNVRELKNVIQVSLATCQARYKGKPPAIKQITPRDLPADLVAKANPPRGHGCPEPYDCETMKRSIMEQLAVQSPQQIAELTVVLQRDRSVVRRHVMQLEKEGLVVLHRGRGRPGSWVSKV